MLLLSLPAFAVPSVPLGIRPPIVPIDGYELCWPSGLKVQAQRRPNTSLVAIATVVGGGTASEAEGERGAAHLVEHLWFRSRFDASPTVAARTAGLEVQGLTFPDATVFTTVGDGSDLDALLRLEAQRLLDPLAGIEPDVIASEQQVVGNEILMRGEHTARAAFRELDAVLFPTDWAYHAGYVSLAENAALGPDALDSWAVRAFRPENVTIRLEGNVDPGAIRDAIGRTFPGVLLRGTARTCGHGLSERPPPDPVSTELVEIVAPVLDPVLFVGWTVPPGWGAAEIDGRLAAFWLQDEIRSEVRVPKMRDGVLSACGHQPQREASLLVCTIPVVDGADPATVVEGVRRAVRRAGMLSDTVHQHLMVSAFDDALGRADRFSPGLLAERALFSHFVDGQIDPTPIYTRRVFAAGPEVVRDYARAWLGPERMAAVVLLPGTVEVTASARIDGQAVLDVPWAGEPGAALPRWTVPDPRLDTWRVETLDNGIEVWAVPRPGGSPVAYSSLGFTRGADAGILGVEHAHDFRVRYSPQISFSAFESGTGVRFREWFGSGATAFTADGPSGNLDGQLWILRVLASETSYAGYASSLDLEDDFWEAFGRSGAPFQTPTADAHLFPGHRYGEPWWSGYRAMSGISRAQMTAWSKAVVHPQAATLVVSGWIDPDRTFELADRYLGGWRRRPGTPTPAAPLPAPPERQVFSIVDDTGLSAIEVSCRLPARTVRNDAALDVLGFLVREGLGQTLRERGGIYAWGASIDSAARDVSVLRMRAQVPSDAAQPGVRAMWALLEQIAAGPSPEVLAWATHGVRAEFARDVASAQGSLWTGQAAAAAGLSFLELKDYPVRVDDVGADDVTVLLGDCVGHEAATVLGPATDLSALGARTVDWEARAAELLGR